MDEEQSLRAEDFGDLLRGAHADPDRQLGRLLEQLRPYLTNIARAELAGEPLGKLEASDIVQITFLDAVQAFRKFRGRSEPEFRTWLARILRNNVRDARKTYRQTQKRDSQRETSDQNMIAGLAADHSTPSQQAMRNEQHAALEAALGRLSAARLELIRLHNQEGKSFKEIGAAIGISEDAARKRWAGVIEELGQLLRTDQDSTGTPIQ